MFFNYLHKKNFIFLARSVCDSNEVGRLIVTIMEGADLQASDPTGLGVYFD